MIFLLLLILAEVQLAWDPNPEPDLAGYKLYWKTDTGTPYGGNSLTLEVSDQPTATLSGLQEGAQHYFVVTAFNNQGVESGYSNEVSHFVEPAQSPCDVNTDGAEDAIDLQVIINDILGISDCSTCDIDQDGSVDAIDLQIMINVILGVAPCP